MTAQTITQFAVHIGLFVLGVSFLLTVWRVLRGPTLPDRVIALDMLVAIVMGFIALIAIRTGFTLYIDIAISLGLVGFLATVAFARFILSRKLRGGEDGGPPPEAAPFADDTDAGQGKRRRSASRSRRVPVASAADLVAPAEAVPAKPLSKSAATKASAAKVKIAKAKEAGKAKAALPSVPSEATGASKTGRRKTLKPKLKET